MTEPLKSDGFDVDRAADLSAVLERLIEHINAKIMDARNRFSTTWDNPDGTFDKFRCPIYFHDDHETAIHVDWKGYHKEVMDAYKQAGWIVKPWFHNGQSYEGTPAYCIALLQTPTEQILEGLQDKIAKP